MCTLMGKVFWTWLQGNFLKDLIGELNSCNEMTRGSNDDIREFQVNEMVQTFKLHMRFYSEILGCYVGCMILCIAMLCLQAVTILSFVGNMDVLFAFKIIYFSFIDYQQWPVEFARIFPSVTVCHVTIVGPGGNLVTYNYLCALPWSQSYLLIFALVFICTCVCIGFVLLSTIYYLIFAFCHQLRESELRNTLKLHPNSSAFKGIKYITPGSTLILVLLSKNVKYNYVCSILDNIYHEFKRHPNVGSKYVNGITVT